MDVLEPQWMGYRYTTVSKALRKCKFPDECTVFCIKVLCIIRYEWPSEATSARARIPKFSEDAVRNARLLYGIDLKCWHV